MDLADRLSIQLYSLRDMHGLDRQLDAVTTAGLKLVETIQPHLDDAHNVRQALDARGLRAPSGHVAMPALRERFDQTVQAARTLGLDLLIVPALPSDERYQDVGGWTRTGMELSALGRRLREHGLAFAYHNHAWELEALPDGQMPLNVLLQTAEGVGWQADVAWLVRGGGDIDEWLDRWRTRIVSVHVKDIAAKGHNIDEDGWASVGAGTMAWDSLLARCAALPARQLVLEHDKPRDPAAFVTESTAFLRGLPA